MIALYRDPEGQTIYMTKTAPSINIPISADNDLSNTTDIRITTLQRKIKQLEKQLMHGGEVRNKQ